MNLSRGPGHPSDAPAAFGGRAPEDIHPTLKRFEGNTLFPDGQENTTHGV